MPSVPAGADAADPDQVGVAVDAVHAEADDTMRTPTTSDWERALAAEPDGMVSPATPSLRGTFPVFDAVTAPTSVSPGYSAVVSSDRVVRLRSAVPAEMTTLRAEVEALARNVAWVPAIPVTVRISTTAAAIVIGRFDRRPVAGDTAA